MCNITHGNRIIAVWIGMTLIEFGIIFQSEKIIIFSNLNDGIVYDTSYDLKSIPIIDWTISDSYRDELKEIQFKDHLLTIIKCFITTNQAYCYSIMKGASKNTTKKITKLTSMIEKKKVFSSIDELKVFCFKNLIKNSIITINK